MNEHQNVARTWGQITIVASRIMGKVSVRTIQRMHARFDLRIQQGPADRSWVFVRIDDLEARLIELLRKPHAGRRLRLLPSKNNVAPCRKMSHR